MTEVFKTNLKKSQAQLLVKLIGQAFPKCRATVDLEDCDKVLCVRTESEEIDIDGLMSLCADLGYFAEPLHDEPYSMTHIINAPAGIAFPDTAR